MLCNIYLCFIKEILEIEILKPKSLFSLLGLGHWGGGGAVHPGIWVPGSSALGTLFSVCK